MTINCKVELNGFLGADPKIVNQGGKSFVVLNVATTDSYPTKDEKTGGFKWKDKETLWHDVLVFRAQAAHFARDLKKGDAVAISGTLAYKPFKDANGYTKHQAAVVANFVEEVEFPRQDELTFDEAADAVSKVA